MTALAVTIVEPAAAADIAKLPDAARPTAEQQKRKGPVQIFVSRKQAKLYVRQDFAPLFDAPLTIAEPDKPWGTHVFTVMEIKDDKTDWTAVTIPADMPIERIATTASSRPRRSSASKSAPPTSPMRRRRHRRSNVSNCRRTPSTEFRNCLRPAPH